MMIQPRARAYPGGDRTYVFRLRRASGSAKSSSSDMIFSARYDGSQSERSAAPPRSPPVHGAT